MGRMSAADVTMQWEPKKPGPKHCRGFRIVGIFGTEWWQVVSSAGLFNRSPGQNWPRTARAHGEQAAAVGSTVGERSRKPWLPPVERGARAFMGQALRSKAVQLKALQAMDWRIAGSMPAFFGDSENAHHVIKVYG